MLDLSRRQDLVQALQALAVLSRAVERHPNPVEELETFMADDPKKTGLDRKLIALNEGHEVRSWTESLKCTEEELRAAVKAVGNSAEKVREYLQKR